MPVFGQKKAAKVLERIPEVELMDLRLNAQSYAGADFSEPNSKFVAHFADKFPAFNGQHIIDLGCDPADITIRLAALYPQASVIGLDGADAMIEIARKAILRNTALANPVGVRRWHIGKEAYPMGSKLFDAVVSNSLLHHLDDPLDLWRAIRLCAAPGAAVLVINLSGHNLALRPKRLLRHTLAKSRKFCECTVRPRFWSNWLHSTWIRCALKLSAIDILSFSGRLVRERHLGAETR